MGTFTVARKVNNKSFLRDEDRIHARIWTTAYIKLLFGIMVGRFDSTCRINGELIEEIEISDDEMLDIMIDNKNKRL